MGRYDIEQVLGDVKSFLVANLNTQISAINTEKNDSASLKTIDSTAYHLQSLEDRVELSDPMVIYGEFDEPRIDGIGPQSAITYRIGVHLIIEDLGLDPNIILKLFRYRRALIDVFQANWATFAREHKCKISASSPTPPFKDQETGYMGRAVGVVLQIVIVE